MKLTALLCCAMFCAGTTPLLGQIIGYPPSQSPYEDLASPQRITLFGGYFDAKRDEAGAAPQSAPMVGAQYEVSIGGPAQFFVRAAWANSQRNAFNPGLPRATRSLGLASDPLVMGDVGVSVNLTGQKSWHHLVPTVAFGVGLASARGSTTNDLYDFGTQFAFSTDIGVSYVFGKVYEIRVGVGNTLYQNHYPDGYYTVTSDSTAVVSSNVAKASYLNNWRLTAGLAVPLFR